MFSSQDALRRHEEMKSVRALEEGDWDDNARLFAPDQIVRPGTNRRPRFDELYDATGLLALDNFVGGIYGQLTNPANRWIEIATDDEDLNKWQPVKAWSYLVTSTILSSMGPAISAFYEQISNVFADTGVFGMGTICQEEDLGKQRIIDRAIPLGQSYIDVDAHGEIDRFHREYELKGRQLKGWWGPVDGAQDDRTYKIIHSTWQNENFNPQRLGPEHGAICSLYCSPDLKGLERRGGYYELPYHTARWRTRTTSPYPIGPAHVARPDADMLQEMERSHIVAAQHAAEPVKLVHDDAVFNASDWVPNAILHGTMSDQGKRLVDTLERGGDLRLSAAQSEQRRNAVREALFFSLMLQLKDRPQMTATEFLGFQEERLRLMGPHLIRIMRMLSSFIARRFGVLQRAGQLPPPPPELQQRRLEILYQSPLAKVQQMATARAAMNYFNAVGQAAQLDPEAADNLDMDAYLGVVHEGFGAPPSIQRDPRLIEQRRQSRAEAQQQATALEQTGQAVTIAAEAAHAEQAGSLAKQRAA